MGLIRASAIAEKYRAIPCKLQRATFLLRPFRFNQTRNRKSLVQHSRKARGGTVIMRHRMTAIDLSTHPASRFRACDGRRACNGRRATL